MEEGLRDVSAVDRAVAEDGLEVHGFPERAGLDVFRVQGEPDGIAIGAEGVGVDEDAREPPGGAGLLQLCVSLTTRANQFC